jgi:hypothetical protein
VEYGIQIDCPVDWTAGFMDAVDSCEYGHRPSRNPGEHENFDDGAYEAGFTLGEWCRVMKMIGGSR